MPTGAPDNTVPDRFDYFMIRLAQRAGEPDRVAGQIERLGTGEKRSFESGEQLLGLFGTWLACHSNMESA